MTLQTSGTISLSDIVAEFGGAPPNALSDYYRGVGLVPVTGKNAAIPAAAEIKLSDFYGAGGEVVFMADLFATDADVGSAEAGIRVLATGELEYNVGGVFAPVGGGQWATPLGDYSADYEFRVTFNIGDPLTSGVLDAWFFPGVNTEWILASSTVGASEFRGLLSVRLPGSQDILQTVDLTLRADVGIGETIEIAGGSVSDTESPISRAGFRVTRDGEFQFRKGATPVYTPVNAQDWLSPKRTISAGEYEAQLLDAGTVWQGSPTDVWIDIFGNPEWFAEATSPGQVDSPNGGLAVRVFNSGGSGFSGLVNALAQVPSAAPVILTMTAGQSSVNTGFLAFLSLYGTLVPSDYRSQTVFQVAFLPQRVPSSIFVFSLNNATLPQNFFSRIEIDGPNWSEDFLTADADFSLPLTPGNTAEWAYSLPGHPGFTNGGTYTLTLHE